MRNFSSLARSSKWAHVGINSPAQAHLASDKYGLLLGILPFVQILWRPETFDQSSLHIPDAGSCTQDA